MINLEKKYYVNVGENGTFAKSGNYYTSAEDVKGIFDFLKEKEVEKLVIYFHGGLVNEENGMGSADFMKNYFADLNSKRHVVSFVWEIQNYKEVVSFKRKM